MDILNPLVERLRHLNKAVDASLDRMETEADPNLKRARIKQALTQEIPPLITEQQTIILLIGQLN